jgi:hypothetical protein
VTYYHKSSPTDIDEVTISKCHTGSSPGSLGSTSKKGMTLWHHCCPVWQTKPRVSPVSRGRNDQAKNHASKEETAPIGVTVVGTSKVFTPV